MRLQTVAALPGEWLKRHPLAGAAEWERYCLRQQARWVQVMYAQQELLRLLEEHAVPCVIIKGAAAAMSYPHPSLRTMGDIDFLVKRTDYLRAAEILEKDGYRLENEKDLHFHHIGYVKNGVNFELHCRLGSIRESNDALISLFEAGIDDRRLCTLEGFTFPVLPPELNGVALLFHVDQHLRSGLGLRQIVDWMMFVHRQTDDGRMERLMEILRETGTEKLAVTVTAMCQKYFGLRKGVPGCVEADEALADSLMEYVMEKGNFGRKSGTKGKIAAVFLDIKTPFRAIRRLQRGGLAH